MKIKNLTRCILQRGLWFFFLLISAGACADDSAPNKTSKTKIFIAGDSTAATYNQPDQQGWGALLGEYVDTTKAEVINRARGGRSSRTFIAEGLWQALIDDVSAGDVVIIQFGHNDASPVNDATRARGTLPGIGTEAITINNLLTQQQETVYTFGHYVRKMVNDVRAKNATPILMSLTQRNVWQAGKLERNGSYGRWAYELALELNTHFVDLNNLVADKLEALGTEKTTALYPKDHTHFNPQGAQLHAETALAAFKGLRPFLSNEQLFNDLLNEKGAAVAADEMTWLRLPIPANPNLRSVFLIGDSTVRNGGGIGGNGEWGWGDFLQPHLNPKKINVVNRAVGGLSSRTFYTGGYWQRTLNMMRPGDVLVMQFGHNDNAPINDDSRARGTLKGVADNYEKIVNQLTGKPETVYSYGGYLRKFIGEARARGIITVVCSPVPRKIWEGKKIARAPDSYPDWARQVALQSGSAFIDLNTVIAAEYEQLGAKKVDALFADKHTHTSKAGAELNAGFVAAELKPLLGL
ncbi:GDSL-type esterase/lipase family protein [Cellvibrio sp. QJXJ]|uniref:GDSL-type esterase/lipase family protein n=1 Tax=Cellvibrio sp. QJXJ TaxID=2964606 RepID=UPI0021C327B6|nr:GDSL-type esterase/lipase family protein [Cellvibrio sp. QJXJ]UUA74192.1 GDSL-type esterase/lipase family protein [Cellvibrio sp. QJXJ]